MEPVRCWRYSSRFSSDARRDRRHRSLAAVFPCSQRRAGLRQAMALLSRALDVHHQIDWHGSRGGILNSGFPVTSSGMGGNCGCGARAYPTQVKHPQNASKRKSSRLGNKFRGLIVMVLSASLLMSAEYGEGHPQLKDGLERVKMLCED